MNDDNRTIAGDAKLLLIAIPLVIWTLLPIYNMLLFALSDKQSVFAGNIWPTNPTLRNFGIVLRQDSHHLANFWQQFFNSVLVAVLVVSVAV